VGFEKNIYIILKVELRFRLKTIILFYRFIGFLKIIYFINCILKLRIKTAKLIRQLFKIAWFVYRIITL
jgi:hypothetical protein